MPSPTIFLLSIIYSPLSIIYIGTMQGYVPYAWWGATTKKREDNILPYE